MLNPAGRSNSSSSDDHGRPIDLGPENLRDVQH
jgi:hypothetical protein